MVISRLVAGIVLLVFGLAVLGSAYDIKSDAQIQFSNLQCNNIHRRSSLFAGSMYYPPIYNDLCFHRRASRWYDDNPGYNPGGFIICPKPWNEIPNSTTNLNFRLATNGWNSITGPY